jgi:hypothetical protein
LIVDSPLLWVRKDLIGMGKVFEFVCCLGIVGILILTDIRAVHRIQTGRPELTRVMLQGTDLVCFLEFCLGAVYRDLE